MNTWDALEKKAEREWEAVHTIFPKEKYSVTGTMRPDFLVTQIGDDYTVGAEVTSFFFHMGSARLKRDESYLHEVLNGNPHEKDVAIMRKDSLVLLEHLDENGNEIELEVVAYTHLPFPEFIALLGLEIEKKCRKYANYQGPASRLHLIVKDEENYFSSWTIEQLSAHLVREKDFNTLLQNAVFYEIFLITNINASKCYIPLKQALFFSRQRLTALFFYRKLMPEVSINQFVLVFIDILVRLGYTQMKAFKEGTEKVCFVQQNMIIKIDKESLSETFLSDTSKFDFLDPISKLMENTLSQIPPQIFEDFLEFQKENYPFVTEVIHFIPATETKSIPGNTSL